LGEREINSIREGKNIETEIFFIKPFAAFGRNNMGTEFISDTQTKVIFSNVSKIKYPLNFLLLFVEKSIAKDMNTSLVVLKNILEA
jgi:hypothetical protein